MSKASLWGKNDFEKVSFILIDYRCSWWMTFSQQWGYYQITAIHENPSFKVGNLE